MIREKKSSKRAVFGAVLLILWGAVFLASLFLLVREKGRVREQQETFEQLRRMVRTESGRETASEAKQKKGPFLIVKDSVPPDSWRAWWEEEARSRLVGYDSMKKQNPDLAGWIRILGTDLDYPVMQRKEQEDYYLHRDFYGKESSCGTPYLWEACEYEELRTNLLISGHHMKDGSMFAPVWNYREELFFMAHPYVQFDLVDRAGSYEIAAILRLDASRDGAICQNLLFPQKKEDFEWAWEQVKRMRFYDTGVELVSEDHLLALLTCEYSLSDGRLLLVARRILQDDGNV